MRKLFILTVALLALAVPTAALADPGGEGQNCLTGANNQNFCGDTITVVSATEEQCPAGGQVFIVNDGREDEESYVVCNGEDGEVGPAGPQGPVGPIGPIGPQGPAGEAGADGADGTNGSGSTGSAGVDGTNGSNGSNGHDGATPTTCKSKRLFVLNIWAGRGDVVRKLTATMQRKNLTVKRVSHRHWQVKFRMTGFKHGVYGVRVSALVNGQKENAVHLYRACYGPGTGLNASTIVRL